MEDSSSYDEVTATATAKDVVEKEEVEEVDVDDEDDEDDEAEEEEEGSLSLVASSSAVVAHNDDSAPSKEESEALAEALLTETSSSSASTATATKQQQQQQQQPKCKKCGKKARKGCTQSVCVKCCTDFKGCHVHIEQRLQSLWRDQIKNGTTTIQKQAKEIKSKCLLTGKRSNFFFRESGFQYMGDTVIIWNIHEFLSNNKWKDDALRKSNRRNSRRKQQRIKVIRNSKRRFRKIIQEKLYTTTSTK